MDSCPPHDFSCERRCTAVAVFAEGGLPAQLPPSLSIPLPRRIGGQLYGLQADAGGGASGAALAWGLLSTLDAGYVPATIGPWFPVAAPPWPGDLDCSCPPRVIAFRVSLGISLGSAVGPTIVLGWPSLRGRGTWIAAVRRGTSPSGWA
jgi:hypothetical protein